jgi:ferredoxin
VDDAVRKMEEDIAARREKLEAGLLESSIVVPVNQALPVRQKVLTGEQVRKLMVENQPVAVTGCGCRTKLRNCDAPVDICIVMGLTAEQVANEDEYRVVTVEEAMEVLDRSAEAGLVHLTLWSEGHTPYAVCSCCACCCHELKALLEYDHLDQVLASDFVAEHDEDACSGCGTCIERCHFGTLAETHDGVRFTRDRCFGCGLCVMTCPTGALTLTMRD